MTSRITNKPIQTAPPVTTAQPPAPPTPATPTAATAQARPAGWTAQGPQPGPQPASAAPAKVDHSLATADAQALHSAMRGGLTGLGTDEAKLFSVLGNRPAEHLKEVKRIYGEHFGEPLLTRLEKDLSGADLRRATALLKGDPVQATVEQLRHATNGVFGAHTKELLETLEGLPQARAEEVRERFEAQFGPLDAAVSRSLTGPARDEALAFLKGSRPEAYAARIDAALNLTHKPAAALDVLSRLDPASVPTLSKAYEARTHRPLAADLGVKLKGSERDLAVALAAGDQKGADVARLRHAVEGKFLGLGKDATAALAVLEGQGHEGRAALDDAYRQKYGASLKDDVVQRFGGREGERLGKALEGKLGDVERLQIAVKGWGADERAVDRVLGGRSKDEVAKLKTEFQARTGEPLDAMLSRELSGRARFDALLALEGAPATPEEAVDQARRRRDFERAGGLNAVSRLVMDRVSDSGQRLDRALTEAEAALAQAKADGHVDAGEAQRLAELTGRTAGETRTYREVKDSAAQGAATAAAVGVAVATAGAGAPLLVGAAAGATAKVATKAALSGQAYSTESAVRDGVTGLAEGLTGTVGGAVAGRAASVVGSSASTLAGRAAQGAVSGAVSGFIQGSTEVALRDETWNSGVAEGLFAAGSRGAMSAATAAAMGASQVLAAEANPLRSNVVATKFPGEKKAVDLSKYRADKATRAAARKSIDKYTLQVQDITADQAKKVFPEFKSIHRDDLIGLRMYTEQSYKAMNSALRGTTKDLKQYAPLVKTASSALNQLPGHTGTVYRGTHLSPENLAKYEVGKIITEKAFMSTTMDKSVAYGTAAAGTTFNGNAVFVIKSKGGGKSVENLSMFPTEKEVLFGPGTEFKVLKTALDKKLGKSVIYLQEVP